MCSNYHNDNKIALYLMNFPKEIVIRVLKSYLNDGMSHRAIQKEVLNLPAPARGGGVVVN